MTVESDPDRLPAGDRGAKETPLVEPSRPTTAQLAIFFNVSESLIYMAKAVMRLRPDLVPQIDAGALRVKPAYIIATGGKKVADRDPIMLAWQAASPEERQRFLAAIERDATSATPSQES